MYLWGSPTACSPLAASGYSSRPIIPKHQTCASPGQDLTWICICSRSDVHSSHMTLHSGLISVSDGGNSGKCAFFWTHLDCKRRLKLQTVTKKWLRPIERGKSKVLSPVFLFTAFFKAGMIFRITPNFTPALKPETCYVRRGITEHSGSCSTSALLFFKPFPLHGLIYDLCRNPHLNPNLAFRRAVLTCS